MEGVCQYFEYLETKRYKLHVRVLLSRYRSPSICPVCHGSRLKPEALFTRICGKDIHEVSSLTIDEGARWLDDLALTPFEQDIAKDILRQLRAKFGFLMRVGLSYLSLTRQTRTLSGGEAQRIALANQLGAHLIGTLYVLDEPTIGLHPRDTATLAGILRDLADIGNTVVVVEHDPAMILAADYIVEMGPWSGEKGGEIVCCCFAEGISHGIARPITARYLRGEESISDSKPPPDRQRQNPQHRRREPTQSEESAGQDSPAKVGLRDGRVRIGQEHAGRRDIVSGSCTRLPPDVAADGTVSCDQRP